MRGGGERVPLTSVCRSVICLPSGPLFPRLASAPVLSLTLSSAKVGKAQVFRAVKKLEMNLSKVLSLRDTPTPGEGAETEIQPLTQREGAQGWVNPAGTGRWASHPQGLGTHVIYLFCFLGLHLRHMEVPRL